MVSARDEVLDLGFRLAMLSSVIGRIKLFVGAFSHLRRVNRYSLRKCGEKVLIHDFVRISNPENIEFDSEIYIGPWSKIFGGGGISIGRGVVLGEAVTVFSSNHNYDSDDLELLPFDERNICKKVTIGDYAWIGQGAFIMPGVEIARYSVIAAGSVVTKSTEEYGVYGGNPAVFIKFRKNRLRLGDIKNTYVSKKNSHHFI
ncbi:acyltransferase [Zoogloea sp.]|uniref:acyltransferase n=1 Tax=Zoogloea sp. TaxID=49181 RepID=UPI0026242764|nr:acyltransferase [Zoogloea sp.]